MKHIVGVADLKISNNSDDIIVTYALGSCLGVIIHDPRAGVGGLLHVMLPNVSMNNERDGKSPLMFMDTALPLFFKQAYAAGAEKRQLKVYVAGGAYFGNDEEDFFAIGKRNLIFLRKLLWKNGIMLTGQDVGGSISRTLNLHVGTGRVWVHSNGQEWDLTQ